MAKKRKTRTKSRPERRASWWRRLATRPARLDSAIALGLAVLAFLHRLAFLRSNVDRAWPFTVFYEGDAEVYFRFARSILADEPYDAGIPFHPPGFAVVLAGIHRLVGAGDLGAQVPHLMVKSVLAAISSLAVGLLYLLVRPYLGRVVAVAASLFAAWHFGLMVLAIAPVTEGVYLTLLFAMLVLWSRALEHPLAAPRREDARLSAGPWPLLAGLALGLLGGVAALVRAESILTTALLGAAGLVPALVALGRSGASEGRGSPGKALGPWLAMAVGVVLVLAPWTVRNAERMSALGEEMGPRLGDDRLPTFVPLTLYGPLNLALANHAEADGTFSRAILDVGAREGVLDLAVPQHRRAVLDGHRMALEWALDEPGAFLGLVAAKWGLASDALALGVTQWNWPGGFSGVRRPIDVFVPHQRGWAWIVGLLAIAGLGVCWRRGGDARRFVLLAALVLGPIALTITLFYGYARQMLLAVPLLLVFVAVALDAAWRFAWRRRPGSSIFAPRWALQALGALAVVLLLVEWSGADAARSYEATGTTYPGSRMLNPNLPVTLAPSDSNAR